MKPSRRVFIVGGAHTPFIGKHHPDFVWKKHPDFGKRENPTLEEHLTAAVRGALEDAAVDAGQIERGYVGNFAGELFSNQGHVGALLVRADDGLTGTPFARVEGACASGGLAVVGCVDALQAGHDIVLAAGAEVQTTVSAREGAGYLARAAHWETERDIDEFTFPAMFARRAKHYGEAFGVGEEDLAHVVVKAYENGARNPYAHMRDVEMTFERAASAGDDNPRFLRNEELRDYLKVTDCSQVSDGASAVVLATEEGLRRLGRSPDECVELIAYGQSVSPLGDVADYTRLTNAALAAQIAYRDGGISADEIDVAEVHDCFAIAEVMMTEALGFAEAGQGAELAKEGETSLDGRIPVNTGGGLLAFGHPVGATGVKQVWEIARQMLGRCGDYQLSATPGLGITANMGGDDRTTVCTVLRNNRR